MIQMMVIHAYLTKKKNLEYDFAPDVQIHILMICIKSIIPITKGLHTLIPRKPNGKFKPQKGIPPKPRYNGPVKPPQAYLQYAQ